MYPFNIGIPRLRPLASHTTRLGSLIELLTRPTPLSLPTAQAKMSTGGPFATVGFRPASAASTFLATLAACFCVMKKPARGWLTTSPHAQTSLASTTRRYSSTSTVAERWSALRNRAGMYSVLGSCPVVGRYRSVVMVSPPARTTSVLPVPLPDGRASAARALYRMITLSFLSSLAAASATPCPLASLSPAQRRTISLVLPYS
ncbi:hypothetical protein VTG60DRAFT_257 [Thermothelomyces hinnuleus]